MAQEIDWSKFEGDPEPLLSCRCGARYRSYVKANYRAGLGLTPQKPCPECGRSDNIWRVSHGPEEFAVRG